MTWEIEFLNWINQNLNNGFLNVLMPIITSLGNVGFIWIALTIVLLLKPKHRKTGIVMAVALVIELVICNIILKPLVARIRPYEVNTLVELLINKQVDYSFPSGHTAASFAAVTALYCSKNRLWKPGLVLAVLIAFSRLYLYMHYLTDVLAGIVIGISSGALGYVIVKKIIYKVK